MELIKIITEELNVKHTNITTIYNQYLPGNYLQKILKVPSSEAWVWEIKNLLNKGSGAQRYESKFRVAKQN